MITWAEFKREMWKELVEFVRAILRAFFGVADEVTFGLYGKAISDRSWRRWMNEKK